MPATATITSYYTFVAGQKARASEVNLNFGIYRGHNLPIDPNTATAIGLTYDLGSTEYRWRNNYVQAIDFQSNTTTGNALQLSGATGTTAGLVLKRNGVEIARFSDNSGYTSTADYGQIATTPILAWFTQTAAFQSIVNSTLTIMCTGRPIELGFIGTPGTFLGMQANADKGDAVLQIMMDNSSTTLGATINGPATLTGIPPSYNIYHGAGEYKWHYVPPAGQHIFHLQSAKTGGDIIQSVQAVRFYAKEIY